MMIAWALLLLGVSTASAVQVNFTADWAAGAGWRLHCAWAMPRGDRLQSVKMYRAGVLFKIYRPEIHAGSIQEDFRPPQGGSWMRLSCRDDPPAGYCDLLVILLAPPTAPEQYTCEVSGERPKFLIVTRTVEVQPYVPSNDATIVARREAGDARVMLNCSATGHPAPNLTWTVGHLKVQGDFTGKAWNMTSKLMHVWSSLALTATSEQPLPVTCTPEQRRGSALVLGAPAEYALEVWAADAGGRLTEEFRIAVLLLAVLYIAR